ncbi:hypothetical protein Ae201684P_003688 [Aphanomyces euteiches]|nr:hypothetical protein Ae201684P_003688 [Aphanomyces euteiches]
MKPSFKGSKFEKTRQTLREIMIEADHAESSLRRLREGVRRALNDLESQKEASNLADIEAFVDAFVQNNSRPARAAWLKHQFEGYKLDLAEQAEAVAAGDAISIDGSSSDSDSSQDSSDDYDPRGKKPRLDERSKDSKLTGVKGKGKLNSDGIVKTRVITAAEVHMLVHIPELPQDVRVAYCKLRDQRLAGYNHGPQPAPKAQLQWSWSLLKWMREKAKIRKQEVEEMVKRVEAGFHLERTGPFLFVNYPEGVFEMPEWMRAQQSTEANFVGKWVSLPGRPVVMDQTDGSFLVGSDVSGQGSADGPTTL